MEFSSVGTNECGEQELILFGESREVGIFEDIRAVFVVAAVSYVEADCVESG